MTSIKQQEPCFRIYLGKSNWVNLNSKITADLITIFEKGVPARYTLAPGLQIDILPNDVDCNSKTTEVPNLMRADLCYDIDDNKQDNPSSSITPPMKTFAERQEAVQQALSRFIKNELESQGIIDAFPPTDRDAPLPHVSTLATHRHLGLVAAPPKFNKRTSNPKHLLQQHPPHIDEKNRQSDNINKSSSTSDNSASSSVLTTRKFSSKKIKKRRKFSKTNFSSKSSSSIIQSHDRQDDDFSKDNSSKHQIQFTSPPYDFRPSTLSSVTTSRSGQYDKGKSSSFTITEKQMDSSAEGDDDDDQNNYNDHDVKDDGSIQGNLYDDHSARTDLFHSMDFMAPTTTTTTTTTTATTTSSSSSSSLWYPQRHFQTNPSPSSATLSSPPLFYPQHHQQQASPLYPSDHSSQQKDVTACWGLYGYGDHQHHQQHQHDFDIYTQPYPPNERSQGEPLLMKSLETDYNTLRSTTILPSSSSPTYQPPLQPYYANNHALSFLLPSSNSLSNIPPLPSSSSSSSNDTDATMELITSPLPPSTAASRRSSKGSILTR
ncbi:uncharacterized protein BX664DRAFT_316422 [Halteromyces radiatus]|uniref:uncharacterized protein n=1 Tax=Halteromyces radiatus TaxID=101107 RepID=UPI002220C0C8|nr:uncharacterized protein BX664DRAFT_316422 [Halteromyces radiatus]KAI8084901.1 hypothetical protein BX664DRAFT_316422 [Halteromyces radiatus]